jgi:hypothetical protein
LSPSWRQSLIDDYIEPENRQMLSELKKEVETLLERLAKVREYL